MPQFLATGSARQLEHARAFLRRHIICKMIDPNRGDAWLVDLDASHRGQLLTLCLAFDDQVEALSWETCVAVLDHLPSPTGDGCVEFAMARTAFERNRLDQVAASQANLNSASSADDEEYVRVLEIGTFTYYYVSPRTAQGFSAEEIGEVRSMYFGDISSADFGDITQVWNGKNNRVWVLPRSDFLRFVKHPGDPSNVELGVHFRGTDIRDALGLPMVSGRGPNGGPDLVAVHYPANCRDLRPRQPTSLDADWESAHVFFIPYGRVDGWGRAYNLSGEGEGCRERVHGPYEPLTHKFFGQYIGEATHLSFSDEDHRHVVATAARRYEDFVKGNDDRVNSDDGEARR